MEVLFGSCLVLFCLELNIFSKGFALTLRCLELAWHGVPECVFVPTAMPASFVSELGKSQLRIGTSKKRNPYRGVGFAFASLRGKSH